MKKVNTTKQQEKEKNKVQAAKRLISTCEKEIFQNGYGPYVIRGVQDLSREDIELIITYCNYYIQHKTIGGLMPPSDGIYEVLKKIDIVEEDWNLLMSIKA